MKRFLFSALLALLTTVLYAQVPNEMNYSVMLLNPETGKVMANETAKIRLELRVGSADGDAVWGQDFDVTTDKSGIVQLVLKFTDDINWNRGDYFLATKVNDQEVGAPKIHSVPFAFQAAQADRLSGTVTHKDMVGTWREFSYYFGSTTYYSTYVFNTDGTGYYYVEDASDTPTSLEWSIDNRGVLRIVNDKQYGCYIISKKSDTELWKDSRWLVKQ